MAIVFTCACGRKLQVADKLAGKKGKCPQCGTVLAIPMESEAIPEEPVVLETGEEIPTEPCPHCKEPIVVGAVFCTKCGTDLRTGQKHVVSGEAGTGYDMFKLWPDVFGKPAHAVGVIVDSPLNADNFVRALVLLVIGLAGFTLFWVLDASPGQEIVLKATATRWFFFPGFFIVGILVLVVDAVMCSLAGKHFGSTGTSLAQTVMALIMTSAVYGFVCLGLGLVIHFAYKPGDLTTQIIAVATLAWSAWLTTSVIYRAYDTSQPIAIIFGVSAAAAKGFLIFGAMWLMASKQH